MDRSLLTGVDLFSDLSEEQLDLLASKMTEVRRPVGSLMTEEGDISDKFFVILAGAVTVHRDGHHVADLLAGDFFGESGTAGTPARRNATVIATTPGSLGCHLRVGPPGNARRAPNPPAPGGTGHHRSGA